MEKNVLQSRVETQNLEPPGERLEEWGNATKPALEKDGVRPEEKAPAGLGVWLSFMTFVWAFDHGNQNQIAMDDGGLTGQAGNVNSQRRSFFQEAWLCRERERKTEESSQTETPCQTEQGIFQTGEIVHIQVLMKNVGREEAEAVSQREQ